MDSSGDPMATAVGATGEVPASATLAGTGTMVPSGAEIVGTRRVKWGALMGFLGLALAIAGIFVALAAIPLGGVAGGSGAQSNAIYYTILAGVFSVLAGVLFAFLSFILYISGFGSLRTADARFRTPRVLGLVGLVGLAFAAVFMIVYADSIFSALACATSDTTCQNNATTLAGGIVVLGYVGGLLGFVGLIGTILGLFRFGSRYSSSLAKVGAILYIIPFAAVIAPILVFVGAHQVQRKFRQAGGIAASTSQTPPSAS